MKIRTKLLISVLSSTFVVLAVITWLSYNTSRKALLKEIENGARSMLSSYLLELDGTLNEFEDVAEGVGIALQSLEPGSEEAVKRLLINFLESDPNAYGSTASFEPGTFSMEKELVGPYFHRGPQGLVYVDLSKSSYNYPAWDWYKTPLQTGKPYWTEPYVDVGGGNVAMTTYALPFFRDKKIWGVATVDVSLKKLTDIIEGIKVGESGFAFLIGRNGTFLSMRSGEWKLKRTIFDVAKEFDSKGLEDLGKDMTDGKTGFFSMFNPLVGKPSWVAYGPIPSSGWSLGIVFPEDEVMSALNSLHCNIIIIAVAGMLAVFGVVLFISMKISSPLMSLSEGARRIASGDFAVKLKGSNSKDEVGVLTKAFGDMQDSLSSTLVALKEEKDMFSVAFTQMSDGFVILNARWNILQSNRTAEKLLSLPIQGPLIEHLEAKFDSSMPYGAVVAVTNKQKEFKLSRREAESVGALHLDCVLVPILNASGQLKEIVMSIRDVTVLESEERSKRDFLSLMSHKLFTPVTVLHGKLMLLKDGLLGKMNEKQEKNVDSMAGQAEKLRGLIESLVNFVTLEEAKLDTSRENINMKEFLDELVKDGALWFPDKHPVINMSLDPAAAEFSFNRKYLKLIVGQLIENGLKFNLSDPAAVDVTCNKTGGRLIIAVNDNGIGIPSEFGDKVFEKFFQIEKYYTGNIEGVGLGLAYVKRIVEYFGGSVAMASEPGMGSTFTISLPVM